MPVRDARAPRLCAVGDFAWDVLIRSEGRLRRGGDTFGSVALLPGGSAANVAVWAARCGADTAFIGKVGTDELGGLAHRNLADEGVADHLIDSPEHPTGAVAVFVDADGERSMVSGHGADHYLQPEDLPVRALESASHVHLTGWSIFLDPPRTAATRAAQLAAGAGASLSFDPSAFQLIDELGTATFLELTTGLGATVIFPNRNEAAMLSGLRDPEASGLRIAELYGEATVVVKLDVDGALVCHDGTPVHVPAISTPAIDTTGAGDAFAGAYLAAAMANRPPVDAATLACQVAAHVVAHVGARPPLPDGGIAAVHG
ncbi:MAG: carbohydrate kinase family protein [Actinomycetota bacterium]